MAKTGIRLYYGSGSGPESITDIDCGNSQQDLGGTVRLTPFTNLTSFEGGDNGLESIIGFENLTSLKFFQITGSNTVSFDISSLPSNLDYFYFLGSNKTFGNIANLPNNLTYFQNWGNNTTTGDISSLPSTLIIFDNYGFNTTFGNISSLKNVTPNLATYSNWGNNTTTGDISSLPNTLIAYNNLGNNTTFGNISSLPATLVYFTNTGNSSSNGNINSLPAQLQYYVNWGNNTTFGNISSLKINTPFLTTFSTRGLNTTTGNIGSLLSAMVNYENQGNNTTFGDISSLPVSLVGYINWGLNTTTGNIDLLPTNLTFFNNQGNNTTFGDIGTLPSGLTFYDNRGSNTTTGDISSLPVSLITYNNIGLNSTTGNIASLPINMAYFINDGLNTTFGDISKLPSGLIFYSIDGFNTTTGNINTLPAGLIYYGNYGYNTTTGNISALPTGLTLYGSHGFNTTTGNLSTLPSGLTYFSNGGFNTTTGNLSTLPSGLTHYYNFGSNTTTGNLSTLPAGITEYLNAGSNTVYSYYDGGSIGYGKRVWANNQRLWRLHPVANNMPNTHLATLLIDLSSVSAWADFDINQPKSFTANINNPTLNLLDPSYGAPLSASIVTLQNKGVTVTLNTYAAAPSFYRDFARYKTLDHGGTLSGAPITFTRNSSATYFDSNGVMQVATSGVPRFDHDPITKESKGLLIEEERSNYYSYSNDFSTSYWVKTFVGQNSISSFTSAASIAPDGTLTAGLLHPTNVETRLPRIRNEVGFRPTLDINKAYTYSVFAKAAGYKYVLLDGWVESLSGGEYWASIFNVENGTIVLPTRSTTASLSYNTTCTAINNGWYQLSMSYLPALSTVGNRPMLNRIILLSGIPLSVQTNNYSSFGELNGSNGPGSWYDEPFKGSENQGVYVWGAQLEQGDFPTSYIPTTTVSAARLLDKAIVTPITSFFNNSEGSMVARGYFGPARPNAHKRILEFNNGTNNDKLISMGRSHRIDSKSARFVLQDIPNYDFNITETFITNVFKLSGIPDSYASLSFGYKLDDSFVAANGTSTPLVSSPQIPVITHMQIGGGPGNSIEDENVRALAGHVSRVIYFPTKLTNTQIREISI